ncbi:MAG: S24/S26 family peptidase [Candidatus Gygaella obscura]|nr:S24/S26 family peptidase [Candidatus Gygaella obscura]
MNNKKDNVLSETFFYEANGYSMWPFLKPGYKLIVKKISIYEIKLGDLVLYRYKNKLICHRVIRKSLKNDDVVLYLRADNSCCGSECISSVNYVGKAVELCLENKVISLISWQMIFVNRLLVIFSPFVYCVIKPLWQILRKVRNSWQKRRK